MDEGKRSRFFDPYHPQRTEHRGRPLWVRLLLSLIASFGASFSLTCLFLAMRGIMRLGGFVASGGPYVIAHPAPSYVWVFPVSIFLGVIFLFLQGAQTKWLGGLNLLALAWPVLFISLGWNFLEFAFRPPGAGGLVWGWLVCGVVFWVMGFVPLLLFIAYFRQGYRERRRKAKLEETPSGDLNAGNKGRNKLILLLQLGAVFLGIYCGALFLNSQTKAKESPPAASAITEPSGTPLTRQSARPASFPQPSGIEKTSTALLKVSITVQGKRLEVIEEQARATRIAYNGKTYVRLSDLPAEARRLFLDSLNMLQNMVIEK
jgi:uncharacterized membrane protein